MKRQGMKPKFKINQNQVIFEYRMLGTNKRTKKIIPLYITIDQDFSKEFGKWLGDRAGGPHKVGVSNKNFDFVLSFRKFLINKIDQPESEIKINLTYNPKFKVPRKLMNKVDKMIVTKTQLGNYSFSVISSNKPLRDFVFDIIEKYWHVILKNSKECARYGYYAGLFEADGSIDIKYPCWSFGLNLNSSSETRILPKLNECIRLKNLLKLDGFDPLISRKISKTQNSYTLKYDLRIFRTKDKIREYKLFKEKILPNITHKEKISKFKMIRGDNFQ